MLCVHTLPAHVTQHAYVWILIEVYVSILQQNNGVYRVYILQHKLCVWWTITLLL
jgi:hypothetical protein